MKCPFCGIVMNYHIANTELDTEKESSIIITYNEVYTCANHGHFTRQQYHREIYLRPPEEE